MHSANRYKKDDPQNALFANNYHMMTEYFSQEGTYWQVRRKILVKYGRILPQSVDSHSKPKKQFTNLLNTSFQEVKLNLPQLQRDNLQQKAVKLKTNLIVSKDDITIVHNHSIYNKLSKQLQHVDSCQVKLKQMVEEMNLAQKQELQYIYSRTQNKRYTPIGDVISKSKLKKSPQNVQVIYSSSHRQQTMSLSLDKIDHMKYDAKHVILLKNLYVY